MPELATEEMEGRRKRLVEVATQMMVSQGVVGRNDEAGSGRYALDSTSTLRKAACTGSRRHWNCFTSDGKT